MFTLTITQRDTTHQIVLAFTSMANAKIMRDELLTAEIALYEVEDDYGQNVSVSMASIQHMILRDVEKHWEYLTKDKVIRMRAENSFNRLLESDPTLEFMVSQRPGFKR